jgi:NADPH oxidase
MFNYLYFNTAYDLRGLQGQPVMGLVSPDFNPVKNDAEDPVTVMWTTIAGVTGHVIIICLFLMITSSIDIMRRSYYEVFWYTHHLFVIFFAGFVIHGIQGLVKAHENVETIFDDLIKNSSAFNLSVFRPDQDPVLCFAAATGDLRDIVALDATQESLLAVEGLLDYCGPDRSDVEAGGAQSWKWVIVPLFVYLVERLLRIYRSSQTVVITKVISHPSKVLEIQMKKKGFHAEAGQYVFLQVPEIRFFEWHPFTLTSSPEEDFFSVHIRSLGDWTEKVAKRCGVGKDSFQQAHQMPKILVDGPFGTCSEDIFKHEVGMAVGAGIGVTPFASILKSCWYQALEPNKYTRMRLKKVYFFWICPEMEAFEWFQSLLSSLEEQVNYI